MIRSVYIHYPYCLRKCGYCSFISFEEKKGESDTYIASLIREINNYQTLLEIKPVTFYFGGGTPSLMKSEEIQRIMRLFDLSNLQESTIEVNPATVDDIKLEELKELPINRISLGAQSFIDKELGFLGRVHNLQDNYRAYSLIKKAGFENVSLDLIYGLPEQTMNDLKYNLRIILELNPEHISTYCLSLEKDTPLAKRGVKLPEDEITASFYRYVRDQLVKEGYNQYEISNFARNGFMSQHNMNYWLNRQYVGFGCSAHGYVNNYRYFNPIDLKSYYDSVDKGILYPNKEEQDIMIRKKDYIIQGLRLTRGIEIAEYERLFGEDLLTKFRQSFQKHKTFLENKNGYLRIKPAGYFVSNDIILDFID